MKSELIKQITNKAVEQLIAALNEGRSETLTQYLAAIGRFHRYSLLCRALGIPGHGDREFRAIVIAIPG